MKTRLQVLHGDHENMSDHQLCQHPKKCERTYHWLIWHEHSSIASSAFTLFLIGEVFNTAVHRTSLEY